MSISPAAWHARQVPTLDVATCDPSELLLVSFGKETSLPAALAREDLPVHVQISLVGEIALMLTAPTVADADFIECFHTVLENPSWSTEGLTLAARLLGELSWDQTLETVQLLRAHPMCTDEVALAAIWVLVILDSSFYHRNKELAHQVLATLGGGHPVVYCGAVLAPRLRQEVPFDESVAVDLPLPAFIHAARRLRDTIQTPEALEVWYTLQRNFTGSEAELEEATVLLMQG